MIRRIIKIDEEKCSGCGLCAGACHEGAIGMVDGKARLLREDYCDGLGDCLPACPTGAISFEEREAPAYDEAAVLAAKKARESGAQPCSCPGTADRSFVPAAPAAAVGIPSQLVNFPVQLKLVPPEAACFGGADLLIAADCTAFAYGDFHREFIRGRVTLIGCPKLDAVSYAEKLTQILQNNDIRSVTVARMTVPCCGGLSHAVQTAVQNCGKDLPLQIVTISPDGRIVR